MNDYTGELIAREHNASDHAPDHPDEVHLLDENELDEIEFDNERLRIEEELRRDRRANRWFEMTRTAFA